MGKKGDIKRGTSEARSAKLYECLLSYGADPIENINRLTALCGELLGATSALYNRLNQGMLCSWGQWNTPPGYNPVDRPDGHLCYTVIQQAEDQLLVVRNLLESNYAQTDPNVIPLQLQTYVGKAVKLEESNIGSLCVVFQQDYIPTEEDELTMGSIASAIAIEEKRYQAEESLRDSQSRYQQAIENSTIPIFSVDRTGVILSWNRACQDLFLYNTEVIGKSYDVLVHGIEEQTFNHGLLWHVFKLKRSLDEVYISFRCKDGSIKYTLSRLYPLLDRNGEVVECVFANTDITERLQAEKVQAATYKISEAAHSTSNLGELYHSIHGILGELMPADNFYIALYDSTNDMLSFPYFVDAYDENPAPSKPGRGLTEYVLRTGQFLLASPEVFDSLFERGEVDSVGTPSVDWLGVPLRIEERTIGVMVVQSYSGGVRYGENEADVLKFVSTQVAMAIERKRTEEALEQHARELALLYKTSLEINALPDLPTLLYAIVERAAGLLGAPMGGLYMMYPNGKALQMVVSYKLPVDFTGTILKLGEGLSGLVAESGEPVMVGDYMEWEGRASVYEGIPFRRVMGVPLKVGDNVIGVINITDDKQSGLFSDDEVRLVSLFADQAAIAIENARLYEDAQLHAKQMAAVSATGRALAETLNLPEIYSRLTHAIHDLLPDVSAILVSIYEPQSELLTRVYGISDGEIVDVSKLDSSLVGPTGNDPQSDAIHTRNPLVIHNSQNHNKYGDTGFAFGTPSPVSSLFVPLVGKGGVLGLLQLESHKPHRFNQDDIELLTLLGNTASITIENARLFAETEQRLRRQAALRAMDMAISSSFDLRVTLNVLLDQVTALLQVDAAAVLLFNRFAQTLEYAAGRGFRGNAITHTRLRLGEDLPGKAAFERKLISIREPSQSTISYPRVAGEDFSTYFGVPLVAKGELKGVLEIFHRASLDPNMEWLEFLEILAGDTAIAIDNTALFYDLQRSNMELTLAYDSTLEGWSRVLEIRRQEPEGHTQRVVDLTMDLAEGMGINETELVHVRRGALLHDVGVMGIPDSILYKPGPLTADEWSILRRHPIYANKILSPIAYLRPSLDIPYCHHEKWDGTGYPRGLKENEIPLSARIFSIVDVWDALRSDRPYRLAWTDQEALEYIRMQSGLHFDPQVVEAFLKIVGKQEAQKVTRR